MPGIGQTMNSEPICESHSPTSPPSRLRLCKWLTGSYLIALLIPVLIYTVLAIWNGILDGSLLFMMIIGFPAAIFMHLHLFNRDAAIGVGYAVFLLTGAGCVVLRNIANLWKTFLWVFLILLLLNLASCVPYAVRLGIKGIE
jgi:hypothetical protein